MTPEQLQEREMRLLQGELELLKQNHAEVLAKLDKIETALIGNKDYKQEGLISVVQGHDELFVKMSNFGRYTIALFSVGASVGTFVTWLVTHINFSNIGKLFK